jgi:basic membrane lipoprotein Med (substrate-binding protein (PBP1-ABC) superfamily)
MELPIAEFISELDPMFYIIECMPNMFPSKNVSNNTIPLVNKIREKNSIAPIIFVELFVSSTSLLNNNEKDQSIAMNKALKTEYEKMLDNGYKNIFYIDSKNALGFDNEGTVDGVHFTDLGFKRYSDFLIKRLQELKLL